MDIKDIQELIKFVAKSGATEVDLEIDNVKISIKSPAMKAGKVEKVYDKQIMHSLKVFLGKGMEKFKNALDDVLMKLQ